MRVRCRLANGDGAEILRSVALWVLTIRQLDLLAKFQVLFKEIRYAKTSIYWASQRKYCAILVSGVFHCLKARAQSCQPVLSPVDIAHVTLCDL